MMAEPDLQGVVLNQEYRVKLGKSFTFPKENAFHTIKYDFKPLSVDHSKPGKLRVGEGDEVNVSLPVVQAESADDVAQFRGPKRPCTRECVLIINTETGEAILEKISSSVSLKSVRDSRNKAPRDRSVSPAPFASKSQAAGKLVQSGKPAAQDRSKAQKMHPKSRTKSAKITDSTTSSAASSGTSGPSLKPPSQASGSTPRGRKSQKTEGKVSNPGLPTDVQSIPYSMPTMSAKTSIPSLPPVSGVNEASPFSQQFNLVPEPAQRKRKLEASSGSSSGSSSSSSSGSSDSDSEEEPLQSLMTTSSFVPIQPPTSQVQSQHPLQTVSASMPILGGGSGGGGGVGGGKGGVPMPAFPGTTTQTRASSSSSGSDSDSSSDSSSSDSSSESSDQENSKGMPQPPAPSMQPQPLSRSYSNLEDELSCSSDSD